MKIDNHTRAVTGLLHAVAVVSASMLPMSCSSVAIPEEHYYRIETPRPSVPRGERTQVLRVEGFELAATLSSDRLLVATSDVELRAYEFHRWLNPLHRLVQDALIVGLNRSGSFADVKGPTGEPGETLVLSGRILDFHQAAGDGGWAGRVTIELRLTAAADGKVLLHEEFSDSVAMRDETPSSAVSALSEATAAVQRQFLRRCAEVGVFSGTAKPAK